MEYTLITNDGKVLVFNLLSCAELFKRAYGGNIVTNEITIDTTATV